MLYLKELVRWLTEHLLKMKSKTIEFRDPVVENVVDKFVSRSDVGFNKYGRTLDTERRGKHKDLAGYLNDIQEELMDAILYIQAAREELAETNPQPEAFRPPHSSDAHLDWTDHVAPV